MPDVLRNKAGLKVNVTLDDRDLQMLLRAIPENLQRRGFRAAVIKGSQIINRVAKRLAPSESGLLRKSIGYKIKSFIHSQNGTIGYYGVIGPRKDGFRQAVFRVKGRRVVRGSPSSVMIANPIKYAHLVALGVKPHRVPVSGYGYKQKTKYGKHPGVPARNFMKNAASYSRNQVLAAMTAELEKAIKKSKG